MLQNPEFDSKDNDPDLHQRMTKAVDGRIKCFNLGEGPANGDQDLNLWNREVIPCFLDGNATSKNKSSCFPAGCADAAEEDSRRGSNVYEVNTRDVSEPDGA
jgi:hypothetical protein